MLAKWIIGLVAGIGIGTIYVVISLSLTMVLATSGVFNFLQGTVVMGGTILSYIFIVQWHLSLPLTVAMIVIIGALAGLATYLVCVRPLLGRTTNLTEGALLTTLGLGSAVNALIAIKFGSLPKSVPSYISPSPIKIGDVTISPLYVVMAIVVAVILVLLLSIVKSTGLGRVFRIVLEDSEGAELLGINVRTVVLVTFAVAGGLSGLAGYLTAPIIGASAYSSQDLVFYGFAGLAIGGFGNLMGSVVGGLTVGVLVGLTSVWNSQAVVPLAWAVVLLTLLIKPAGIWGTAGLFGAKSLREV